jgi:penicillin amidase
MSAARVIRVLSVASLLAVPVSPWASQLKPPDGAGHRLSAEGLRQTVEIIRDRWGINHIYAGNEHDLFFAQGYAAARDRLWQFEIWRRQATGTTAEILGRRELKRDIGTRLHMFRGDLKAEMRWYHPRGEEIITAYVSGINAYVAETDRNPALLPLEFRLMGIKPGRWTPDVVISRHNGLLDNLGEEIQFAQAIRVMGVEKMKSLQYFQGGDPDITPDPAIDLSLVTKKVVELYDAFREPITFRPEDVLPAYRGSKATAARFPAQGGSAGAGLDFDHRPHDIGSNNWVVSGKLTQSGYPMMMNDPHRALGAPSLRYWVHLVAPGWNVIGGGEPTLPGVSIGHNEHGAWGLTVFGNDSEDLYVYQTNPARPNQYRYRGAWEDMQIIKDTIAVKGEGPVAVELKYTRHGPVLFEDTGHHTAYALRAAWMEVGASPYLASLRVDQAASWKEFREACAYSRIPSENMVWADVKGNIGYQAVGIQPLRRNWSGLVPVPGDGRYEWDGFLPITALPSEANPERGFVATANNYLFPIDYPYKDAIHYTWAEPYRAMRITEVLGLGRLNTVPDMVRLQNDDLSIPARQLVPLLRDLAIDDPVAAKARDILLGWNAVTDKDSVPAGIYEMWIRRLQINVRDTVVPRDARPFVEFLNMKKIVDWMYAPDGGFGANPTLARDELLVKSLNEAVAELGRMLGADMGRWQWGQEKYHHALIQHPLDAAVNAEVRARLDVGPFARGGDAFSPSATGEGDNQVDGGSFKIIADTENWDNSLGLNTPGQSGDPASPHYRDLFELWARGKYFPIFYSRPKVESVAEERLLLEPR